VRPLLSILTGLLLTACRDGGGSAPDDTPVPDDSGTGDTAAVVGPTGTEPTAATAATATTATTGHTGHTALTTADTGHEGPTPAELEDGEWLPGGEVGTNALLLGVNSFKMPMPGLSEEHEALFYSGNSWFNQSFVSAPATTTTRDGLGPLYNATGCSSCHFNDGRGAPPEDGLAPLAGLLLRLSTASGDPDPVYGGQLQDVGILGVPPEAVPRIVWTAVSGSHDDGTPYELLAPDYLLESPTHGPFAIDLQVSPRVAPQMIGLGLLDAVPEAHLLAASDPDDLDGDGISGRPQWSEHPITGEVALGRFGWKGEAIDVEVQSAGAFNGDLGLTSDLFPVDDCTSVQTECLAAPDGGSPEIEGYILERVVLYSRTLAVPARRAWDDDDVLLGKGVFAWLGCGDCHTPSHTTGTFAPLPELEGQTIWPYTDLLLHDMGEGLADHRPVGEASGREWKTPPLWGLGLVPDVNGHTRYLHDGRARSLEEAILWHGGEAEAAADGFRALPVEERQALLRFLEDL